jgi:hypothetical protein
MDLAMNEQPTGDEAGEPQSPDAGVFGKLPASRPGTRSPRRHGESESPGVAKAKASEAGKRAKAPPRSEPARPKPQPAEEPPAAGQKAQPPPEPVAPADQPAGEGRGGIEDLAWAGIAAAAEAATLGVRLASRAMGAVRDSVDRR